VSDPQQGIFGIDLGTTYSVVGYIDDTGRAAVTRNGEGDDTTPSVVYFENEGNVVVGQVAKESAGLYPDQVVSLIKREMGDRDYQRTFFGTEHTPPSISALILSALAKDAEADTGRKVTDAVITVPAYFGLLEKDATRQAGEIAGLNVIGIVPEPVAAALHYGVTGSADGTTFLVYDLGGGTFDISLIKMTQDSVEVLAVGGDHRLGGADWDEKLFDYIVEQTIAECGDESLRDDEGMLQELRTLAEKTKKDLSAAETKTLIVRYTGTAAKFTVTRKQFEEMTADLLDETIRITTRTLAEAEERHPGIRKQISQLLLVGGSSRMPAVSERLKIEFDWEPRLTDPDLAVAKGAALYAAGQTVRYVETDGAQEPAPGGAGSGDQRGRPRRRQAVRTRRRPGPGSRPADGRQRAAEVDRHQAGRHDEAELGRRYRLRPLRRAPRGRSDPAPVPGPDLRGQHRDRPSGGHRDRDLGAGGRQPEPRHDGQPPGRRGRSDQGPGPVRAAGRIARQH
jgi:molecular chaperone DnaK